MIHCVQCPCALCADQLEAHERTAELASSFRKDDARLREAESWVAGTFEADHYTAVTLALHALHHTDPSDLLGSSVLTRLYQLAKVEAEAIDEQLMQQAIDFPNQRAAA